LKNKNIACSFNDYFTLKIIKIKNNNEYENIQIINKAHNNNITKIIELNNGNIITFSHDCYFKIWKSNNNYNEYAKIYEFNDSNYIFDGIEIKDNEILYSSNSNPQSLVFFDLNFKVKFNVLKNLKLYREIGCRSIKLNNDEVVVAGDKKIYLIDINNYEISHEIDTDYRNYCILKLSNNLFLTGDSNGTITQYKIKNKYLNKESIKNNCSKNSWMMVMTLLNDKIITAGDGSNEIKIWKNVK
jgi:WD40 repeat protein